MPYARQICFGRLRLKKAFYCRRRIKNSAGGELRDTLVTANTAEQDAGGGTIEYAGNIVNCTIVANTAANRAGGLFVIDYGRVANTIIWGNNASISGNHCLVLDEYSPVAISNSCSWPLLPGTNNLAADPLFIDASAGNWRLHWNSPCIDAGADMSAAGDTDLDGNPRKAGAHEDMGVYEKQVREHILAAGPVSSTRFRANWQPVEAATNYWLDVATVSGFTTSSPAMRIGTPGLTRVLPSPAWRIERVITIACGRKAFTAWA